MPFVGKNNLTAKERLYGEAIINQTRREREKAQQEAEEKARRWASLQMDNADKGPMPSPREMISLGGQALTSGTVQTAADAIQRMRQKMLEQEQQRKEEERRRALYQPKPEQTARDLAGMRLDAGDFAKVGGQALTSGTVQSAAKSLGSHKQSKQPSGPVKVDFMGVSSERDARLELLNENLRRLEDQRKMQEAKAAPNQEERQAQQEAFWRDRALSTGYSPNSSVQMSTRQQEAAEKAGALKNQERELGQYIKYLEGQGVQDRAQNAVTKRDVQRGLNSTIEKGDITTGNEKVRSLARAIQYGKLGLEPHGFNETDISANMKWADALTERQKDTILAFAGREDWDGAQRYLDSISDQLNQKVAESEYNDLGTAGKALYWVPAGIDQFASGIAQLGDSEARNQTVTNRVSQMVQQDAYDTHPGLGFLYDMGTSISNMTPSILLSAVAGPALGAAGLSASTAGAVAGGIGSAALGASAGGNAYAEKRRQGYGTEEAAAYATLVGASEAGLQYVLGGISKLGATPLAKATEMVSKIDNAFGQAALHLGANMLSEGVEEGLQEVLEPAFATLILDEKYQVSPQEVVTSFLMGALTAGLLEGMGAVRAGRAGQEVARNGGFDATAVDGYMGKSGVDYFRGVSNLEEASQGLDILDDYYGLSQGQNEDIRADVERQYAMRSAWYEGRDQARRATEQTATEEAQAAEPEGLRLGAMWEDTQGQTAQGTPKEAAGADQTARLVQEARETVEAARAAQEDQSGEPEGLRLGAMWEDAQSQTAQGTPLETAGADQTARLVQEARETVQAARAAQEAQNQEGQFQRVQPVNTAQPEGLTLGGTLEDNEASNPQNLNEGAGVNGREEDAAPAAGAETTAGRDLLDGEPGRVYGQGPGQQAGVVEEGPAGADQTSEQGRAASARNDLAKNLRGQEVSSRQLGLSRGTDTANVLVMPQELWDTEMVQVAQEVQARTGSAVTYVLGDIEVSGTDGSVSRVRGVQMPGQIIVRADHRRLSVEQIAKHEEFHVYAGRNTNMVRDAENRIMAKYDQAEFQTVINTYIKNLRGVIDIPQNGTSEQVVEAYYRILEEIFADAYAGINAFGVETSRYQETVREVSQEREAIRASRENAKATERKTGPTDTAKENGAGVRDGGVEGAESAEQSSEEDAKKQEVYRQAKEMRDALRDAYAEGRISEAEYDAAMDVVLEQVDVDGGSMLEMFDRWDREEGLERYSTEDEEMLDEFAIGDDGNIYLPGQPMPEAVKRMRAKSLDRDGSAAYDGGNQKGAVDYEQGSIGSETEEIYLRNEREGRPGAHAEDRGRKGSVSETPGEGQRRDTQKGGGKEKLPKSEKEHIVETTKTEGSNWAKSTASQYTKDVYFVSHAALQDTKKKNQRWGVTTGDGIVFLSDQIPDHLGITVGYHEVVHVAKRKRFIPYTDFLADTVSYIDRAEYSAQDMLDTLADAKYDKPFMELDVDEVENVYDELNAYAWGYYRNIPEEARKLFEGVFINYDDYIHELDAIMEQMRLNHEEESLIDQPAPETVQQTPPMNEQANGPEKFSVEDEETLTEFAFGDDGHIYLPGQPMPEAVRRMRAAQQKDASVDRNQLESVQREAYSAEGTQDGIVDTLPRKAKNYLSRAERAMVRKLGDLLSVPTAAQWEYLQETARAISEEYLKEGRISQKTVDRLFETAYAQGVVVQNELREEYGDLYNRLRNTELVFSKEYTGDIPDFDAFRKQYFNRLKISTNGRTNIDQVYMELSQDYPGFFNQEEHSHPSDQLMHIAKVMDDFRLVERNLDEYYGEGAEDFKRWAKHDFEVAVTDMLGDLRNVKRYTDERAAAKAEQQEAIPKTQAEVEESWKRVKDARRAYEKAAAKNLLTNDDRVEVGRLLRGEIKLEHLDPDKFNVKGIKAVYEAREEYERLAKGIKAWNRSRKEQLKTQADTFLETANDWKDKKAGILYSRETMERNIRDIIKDKDLAEQIISTYFTPVHQGAAAATRTKNSYRERVRELNLSRKVEKGNVVSEAHAVQLLGEAEDNIRVLENSKGRVQVRDGKTLEEWNSVVAELWEQNPNLDEGKIRNAVKEFRVIYDDLFQQMNEVRVRNGYEPVNYRQGYFPHFQPGNEEGIMAAFGRAMGISTEVTALPTTINGLTHTFRPGIRWFGNAQERLGFNTAYDAVEGFDRYIEGVADVIHQTDNIQRLRALASQIRYRTGDEGIRRQVDAVREDTSLTEQDKQNRIEKIYESGRYTLSNFVVELEEYANLLANKKSRADRNMEQALGRRAYNIVKALESRVAANMVAINPGSWLTNFIPLTQGGALLDRGMLLHGMWDTLRAYKGDDGFVDTSTFLTNRRGSDPLVKTWAQKASEAMSKPMEYIDQFTADSLVRARYRQNVKRGMSEAAAIEEADAWTAGVMADRSKGSMPTLFERKNPMTKIFTQFQLEVNNQLSYLFKDMPRDTRDKGLHVLAAALIKFAIGAFLYDEVYEFIVGRRPALDPIGMLNDTVGDLTGWELPNLVELGVDAASGDITAEDFQKDKGDLYDAAEGLAGNVAENLPFISGFLGGGRYPVMNALPDFQNAARAALDSDWSAERKLYELSSGFENPLTYLLLPFGGGQLKKIYNGVKAAVQGGKYSVNSDGEEILQYPMFMDSRGESIANVTRAILFGTTSLPTGQEWVEEGFKSLTAEQTVAYKWMMEEGVTGREAFYLIKELRSATKTDDQSKAQVQRDILEKAGLNDGTLEAAYYTMVATNKEREIIDTMEEAGADTGVVTRALMELKQADATTQDEVERVLRSVRGLTNAERRKMWQLQNAGWAEKNNPF